MPTGLDHDSATRPAPSDAARVIERRQAARYSFEVRAEKRRRSGITGPVQLTANTTPSSIQVLAHANAASIVIS